jgi:hypothetical protein
MLGAECASTALALRLLSPCMIACKINMGIFKRTVNIEAHVNACALTVSSYSIGVTKNH